MTAALAAEVAWPLACIAIAFILAVMITILVIRLNRVDEKVRDALDYERAKNARHLPPPPSER